MKIYLRFLAVSLLVFSLSSCAVLEIFSAKKIEKPLDYVDNAAQLDIKNFFNGDIEGFGIVQNSDGKIVGTVVVKIVGKWDDNKGTIQQNFTYHDGRKDNRTLLITTNSDATFDAVGHDVVKAAQGKQIGNAAQSNYSLMIGQKSSKAEVAFEDRMYLVDDKSLVMISSFSQKVATNFFEKKIPEQSFQKNLSGKTIFSLKKISN